MNEETCGAPYCPETTKRSQDPAVNAWLAMARIVQRTEKLLTANLQCQHLNAGQLDVLMTAAGGDGLTQQELAERLCHSKANVSQLLDKMERAELVQRVPEGRAYRIFLTESGRTFLQEFLPEQKRIVAEQFQSLSSEDRDVFFQLVDRLDPAPE